MISRSDRDIPSIAFLYDSRISLLVFSAGSGTFDSLSMSSLQGSALLFLGDRKHSRPVSEQFLVVSTCSVWDSSTLNLSHFEACKGGVLGKPSTEVFSKLNVFTRNSHTNIPATVK